MGLKKYNLKSYDKSLVPSIVSKYGVGELMAHIMCSRNLTAEESANEFFSNTPKFDDPFLLKDMDKAVNRILSAIEEGETICVYGDYDADGVTSTVMVYNYLYAYGADVFFYIPSRESEGYGLNVQAVKNIAENGATLILTVDNGISACEEIDLANSLGIDVVVTDHHMPPEKLPNAVAVVNPHRCDCEYPFKDFAGVGVAFKLLCALEGGESDMLLEQFSPLVAIGTVADVVSLTGENRHFVKMGVNQIQNTEDVGLYKLLEECSLLNKKLTAESLSFVIAPKINAAGRVGNVNDAVNLLISEDEDEAQELIKKILSLNNQRKDIESDILKDIDLILSQNPQKLNNRVLTLSGKNWHHGIIGIVCARLMEKYSKPCVLMSICDNGEVRASARSVRGFSIIDALKQTSTHLTRYGGHEQAAGFSLMEKDIARFENALEEYAFKNYPQMPVPTIEVDKIVTAKELTIDNIKQLNMFEPFGRDNEKPNFMLLNAKVEGAVALSQGKHTRLRINCNGGCVSLLWFSQITDEVPFKEGDAVDVVFNCEIGEYNGAEQLTLKLKDIRPSAINQESLISSLTVYNDIVTKKSNDKSHSPTREEIGVIYTFLRKNGGYKYSSICLYNILKEKYSYAKMMLSLEIMKELNLIDGDFHSQLMNIKIIPQTEKLDLNTSELFCRIH